MRQGVNVVILKEHQDLRRAAERNLSEMTKGQRMDAIVVQELYKYYGETKAVDGISFTVQQGEVFGMLGPNGAGKTTTVEIIEGLRVADRGQVTVLGMDVRAKPAAIKARIGVQLQTTALYPLLTVREVIELFRSFYPGPVRDTDYVIGLVNLQEKQKTRSKDLSGGQQQRLSMALALVNRDPTSSFSTSRPPGWTRRHGARCGTSSSR